jgi:hypothetical protein
MTQSSTPNPTDAQRSDGLTGEQRADRAADTKVVLLIFIGAVAFAVVFISGWSPQF